MADILKKLILDKNLTLKIGDFTAGKNGTLLIEQDEIGGYDLILPSELKYRGEVKLNKLPHQLTLIKWVIDDEGVLFSVSYPGGSGGGNVDLSNYYNKGQADSLFYPLIQNPAGYITQSWVLNQGYIKGEYDTLDSVLKRGNISAEDMTVTGKVTLSKELIIPTTAPAVNSDGNIWVGSNGSTSTPAPVISYLNDLADVTLGSILNNQVLMYDTPSGQWINKTINIDVDFGNFYTKTQSDSKYKTIGWVPSWAEITDKPSTFTPSSHTHSFAEITGKPNSISGFGILDAYVKSEVYNAIESDARYKTIAWLPSWSEVQSKPTNLSQFTNDLGNYGNWITKAQGDTYYTPINSETLNSVVTRGNSTSLPVVLGGKTSVTNQLIIPTTAPSEITDGSIWVGTGSGGGKPTPIIGYLNDLQDVTLGSILDKQVLMYDTPTNQWINKSITLDVDLSPYALKNGSNSTGTWGINITGTSALSFNSGQWNGYDFDKSNAYGSGFDLIFGRTTGLNEARLITQAGMQNFVGTNNGSTLNNNISGKAEYAGNVDNGSSRMAFEWQDGGAQPTWVWGSVVSGIAKVYNPSNFNVNSAVYWGGRSAELNNASVTTFAPVVIDGSDGKGKLGVDTQFKTWLGLGANDTRDTFLRVAPDKSTVQNGNFAIGSHEGRNFIQSHGGQPLDINPLGNVVTINGTPTGSFTFRNSINGNEVTTNVGTAVADIGVAKLLRWKNYGDGHVIFDASQGTAPNGTAHNQSNAEQPWSPSYPSLMGWNGSSTYGVRVDSARIADASLDTWDAVLSRGSTAYRSITIAGDRTIHYNNNDNSVAARADNRGETLHQFMLRYADGATRAWSESWFDGTSYHNAYASSFGFNFQSGVYVAGSLQVNGTLSGSRGIFGYDAGYQGGVSASNWFRSKDATGWVNESYGGGVYMSDSSWVRVYNGKGFWADNQIRGTEVISQYAGFKSNNFTGLAGDYEITGTTDKIIWTIGSSWNAIASMYGIGYQYYTKYGTDHSIVFRNAGTVKASIALSSGNAFFDGRISGGEVKASTKMIIPISAPSVVENGCIWIA
ncbi:shufflon system plasmid conjugative transfer pilus tip adhesin PilV [Pedobacter gandavensis]|uniref:shufflon system plasmid conjugative transfer pilus tip adhesin PilV n=1 Tax=Pedobacter gandavensis TaxID=2679963 RepID=UPI00292CF5B1|nr:shufflon system plasmid conjugative transfer pilus tip adhesin PilV [Pedobacter gandavensis]